MMILLIKEMAPLSPLTRTLFFTAATLTLSLFDATALRPSNDENFMPLQEDTERLTPRTRQVIDDVYAAFSIVDAPQRQVTTPGQPDSPSNNSIRAVNGDPADEAGATQARRRGDVVVSALERLLY